jgi:hypothetical protein
MKIKDENLYEEIKLLRFCIETRLQLCKKDEDFLKHSDAICALVECIEKLIVTQSKLNKIDFNVTIDNAEVDINKLTSQVIKKLKRQKRRI